MSATQWESTGTRSINTEYQAWTLTNAGLSNMTTYTGTILDTLYIYVSSTSGANTLTCKVSRDSNGDELIIPEFTTGTLSTDTIKPLDAGETTATDGTAIIALGSILPRMGTTALGTLYLWIKSDGTATGDECRLAGRILR